MAKLRRPRRPYQTSWGEVVAGLAQDSNGRWRVVATGERFREQDERLAVLRFRRLQTNGTLFLPISRSDDASVNADAAYALDPSVGEHAASSMSRERPLARWYNLG